MMLITKNINKRDTQLRVNSSIQDIHTSRGINHLDGLFLVIIFCVVLYYCNNYYCRKCRTSNFELNKELFLEDRLKVQLNIQGEKKIHQLNIPFSERKGYTQAKKL